MASLFRSRALHTSTRLATADSRKQTADFLARLSKSREEQSASAANTNNAARSMIDSVGLRELGEDTRRQFLPNKVRPRYRCRARPRPGHRCAVRCLARRQAPLCGRHYDPTPEKATPR